MLSLFSLESVGGKEKELAYHMCVFFSIGFVFIFIVITWIVNPLKTFLKDKSCRQSELSIQSKNSLLGPQ